MAYHAKLGPSGASRWMACPGSVYLSQDEPDTSSDYADEGTAAHWLASLCLTTSSHPKEHLGEWLTVVDGDCIGFDPLDGPAPNPGQTVRSYEVTDEMVAALDLFLQAVYDHSAGKELFVEVDVPLEQLTGEAGATGRSDVILMGAHSLAVFDLKYGRGVAVDAHDNPQLKMYALGALEALDLVGDIQRVDLFISQPRLNSLSWSQVTAEELRAWAEVVRVAADAALAVVADPNLLDVEGSLNPGEEQCRFCKAKAKCPALAEFVQKKVGAEFAAFSKEALAAVASCDDVSLSTKMNACNLIEDWIKAVRAKVESELLAGHPVEGWKLVEGRQGNREWIDKASAETLLKSMRLKIEEMYNLSVISPTQAEKLAPKLDKAGKPIATAEKPILGPKQWKRLQEIITRRAGQPSVQPASDKRPALVVAQPTVDDFDALTASVDDFI